MFGGLIARVRVGASLTLRGLFASKGRLSIVCRRIGRVEMARVGHGRA
jgi:hypothetical protein